MKPKKNKPKYRHEYSFHFFVENNSLQPPTHIPTLVKELKKWAEIEPASINHLIYHEHSVVLIPSNLRPL